MRKKQLIHLFAFFAILLFANSCKDDKENIASTFEIASENLVKNFDKNSGSVIVPLITNLEQYDWDAKTSARWLRVSKTQDGIKISVDANPDADKRSTTVQVSSKVRSYTITVTQYGASGIVVEDDFAVNPYGGKASEYQSGSEFTYSYDGQLNDKHYHSSWNNTQLPVTLEYYFRGDTEINYIIYNTRSGNGNFGELEIWVATDAARSNYTKQGDYDFMMQGVPSKVTFSQGMKATGIKFVVKTGQGGFVSCSEMQFFKKNTEKTLDKQLLAVFTDITCTELKDGVTQEQIDLLPEYFVRVAESLRDGTYDQKEKDFRIRAYKPYSNIDEWANKLMTKRYSNLDNPTGIYVKEGDEVVILVGDTYGQQVAIQNIGEERTDFLADPVGTTYLQTAASGDMYFLNEGVNKITAKKTGMLFIMYNTNLQSATAKPIKIHIPLGSGKVCGFFDLEEHKSNDKYKELIEKSDYKYFCVRGNKIIFYFHRNELRSAVPYDILSAIGLWDDIIGWQQELMGIEDVRPAQVNNHLFAISPEGAYMWASDYRIAFVYTSLAKILLKENVLAAKDNAWGPAHEIGHVHQLAIDWPSSSESSNNLFSNFILYKLGKYCSRGTELMLPDPNKNAEKNTLVHVRCVLNKPWCDFGDGHQGENTETHMRMNWQLWSYYHRCGYKTSFWQTLFKLMRDNRTSSNNPGEKQLLFAKMASKAANENLTDFFEMWGLFVPVQMKLDQYGSWDYKVTESMIQEAKNYMAQFPKPKHAFYYLEDRKTGDTGLDTTPPNVGYYTQYKNDVKITKEVKAVISGQKVTITNGEEAVAFEIRKNDKLVYFSTFFSFEVPASISLSGAQIYAIQADGKQIATNIK